MTKKSPTKKTAKTSMEIEVFEKKYQRHIEMMTESILDTKTNINDKIMKMSMIRLMMMLHMYQHLKRVLNLLTSMTKNKTNKSVKKIDWSKLGL